MKKRTICILVSILCIGLVACANDGYVERKNFGALYEPLDRVLHGGGQDPAGFLEYADALGEDRYPVLWMTYIGLEHPPEHILDWGKGVKRDLDAIGRDDLMPQIGLSMTGGNDDGSGLDALVARGDYDAQIEAFCEALAFIGRDSFVRIGYEFEGSWNNYSEAGFVGSWKRITTAMRERDLPVATVWCSGGGSAGPRPIEEVMAFYPGDEWVDWWGVDVFSPGEIGMDWITDFCELSGEHGKPVMLGEVTPRHVGVLDGQKDWDEWFGPFFERIRSQPEIKAFCYINWEWDYWSRKLGFQWHDWGDARLQMNETVLEAYRMELDRSLYEHSE
ncbi:hypothetical protein QEH56_16500 [Pelagicoccus enzymogenes]|uniref:hypothetical protein n=1 Tax=Pelagicoccus enzymogenes TaxID=2773457 RepID=UPI00280E246E|nr:hypothetical protein [Pelagicoccus enzymogenes]MDQ8199765.1 hypothetical protein [Pelagicoccus enzymogenes]